MLESHFGLSRRPFPTSPTPGSYYPATNHEIALSRLLSGIEDGEGLMLLVGDPGVGKTMLALSLIDRVGTTVEVAFLTHTHLRDRVGLLQAILFDLSQPHQGLGEQELRLALVEHLLKTFALGKRTILLIDEAHHLSPELLEELRLLSNLEGQGGKAVQVVLIGQTSLVACLAKPELASLRQRLAVRTQLEPLGIDEAADYLLHHVRAAGGCAEQLFTSDALELIARGTLGLPRLLNQVAMAALRMAASAESGQVDYEAASEALGELGLDKDLPVGANEEMMGQLTDAAEDDESGCRLFLAPSRSA